MLAWWLGFILLVVGRIFEIVGAIAVACIAAIAAGSSGLVSHDLTDSVFRFGLSLDPVNITTIENPIFELGRAQTAFLNFWLTASIIWAMPVIGVALLGEIFGQRFWAFYIGGTALFFCVIPLVVSFMPPRPGDMVFLFIGLACTGAVAGFAYWFITGRRAGLIRRTLRQ
ncbi:hypothetical protein J8I29_28410 [Labrys sp. LIt4]|uniref:hypothetical protein n=1 Tax=Labrys sp. LIt4 TaxID=2821355 RepID=UPI001AE040F9|nr:hypothetical protein [Labrys sp. LIt4]MBP0583282.1 hypothetical protein [Labrys sp. LIt4]